MQRRQLLKEEFQLFWEYASPAWAAKFLHAWCDAAAECLLAQGQVDTATVLVDALNVPKAGSRILEAVHETAHDVHAAVSSTCAA